MFNYTYDMGFFKSIFVYSLTISYLYIMYFYYIPLLVPSLISLPQPLGPLQLPNKCHLTFIFVFSLVSVVWRFYWLAGSLPMATPLEKISLPASIC